MATTDASEARTILVVDDDEDAAYSFAEILSLLGHKAKALCDPLEVMNELRAQQPDIVFLDIGMPGMDGYELAKTIRQEFNYEDLKLVAVTAYAMDADRRRAARAGFDAHVAKPADYEVISAILKQLR